MKVITLVGNATKDAEVRNTQSGDSVCSFTIAVNDRRANETYYFECSYWGKAGQGVAPYITKGKQVTVNGDFAWREYNDKKYLQVRVSQLQLGQRGQQQDDVEPQGSQYNPTDDMDDDIPF